MASIHCLVNKNIVDYYMVLADDLHQGNKLDTRKLLALAGKYHSLRNNFMSSYAPYYFMITIDPKVLVFCPHITRIPNTTPHIIIT